jgi:hypothetical protein
MSFQLHRYVKEDLDYDVKLLLVPACAPYMAAMRKGHRKSIQKQLEGIQALML